MGEIMGMVMDGKVPEALLAGILVALAVKGETVEEIAGAIDAMNARTCVFPETADDAIDVCGTGGDRSGTVNLSTAAAFVLAGAGAKVIKHGNRAISSQAGSADVLEALGVRIDPSPSEAARIYRELGLVFLFAPLYHPALKLAAPVRRDLGVRTLFNLLGPLSNPARVKRQVVGVYDRSLLETVPDVLSCTGSEEIIALFGDGIDEVNLSSTTTMVHLSDGTLIRKEVRAEDFGLCPSPLSMVQGGDRSHNAALIERVLNGERLQLRDWVLAGAAPGFLVAGMASSLEEGVLLGQDSIDSGKALSILARWREYSA
jgi:anthranilate phosphoribosyltransferase